MASSCSYIPHNKKGEELKGFQKYKNELGYKVGSEVFTQVLSPTFQEDYKKTLEFDNQNVPTYDSAIRIKYIKDLIGTTKLQVVDQKKYPFVKNNRENYQRLVASAHDYNQHSSNNDSLVAVVTHSKDGKEIRVEIREKTEKNTKEYQNQYGTSILNQKLIELLSDLGIDINLLQNNETVNGYVDFSKAKNIADGFIGLINIANGMEGELALSEEFAHVIIGMFRDSPLVQRSLNVLLNNSQLVQEVLGDEYQRNLEYYSQNPNYDAFGNEIPLEETMAEEALGRILQEKLKTTPTSTTSKEESKPLHNLISRLLSWLKKVFKGRKAEDIAQAKNEADASMGELARGILSGNKPLSAEALARNARNARFNNVRDATDKVLQLLKNATEIERKRSKISPKEMESDIKKKIRTLESYLTDVNKMEGLHEYAMWALKDLQDAMAAMDADELLDTMDFATLRHLKAVLDSYSDFIDDFHEALDDLDEEDTILTIGGEEVKLRELWREIDDTYKSCIRLFQEKALDMFSKFLAPIYDKSPLHNPDGSIRPIRDVLVGEDIDISELDRWLISMGNSSSIILQLFDKVVKNAKDKVRERTIDNVRAVWKLRDNAESRGIKSFEWLYERDNEGHKTGYYVSPYNIGQFEKERKELEDSLVEKYGKHPVGEDFRRAFVERKAWYDSHAKVDPFGNVNPGEMYRNPEFVKLTDAQRLTWSEILDYKDSMERELPANKRNRFRAIQRRRSGTQRIADIFSNTGQAYESIKEDVKSAFSRSEDDDILYGDRTRGLTDFKEKEYLTLPILYTGRLKNPDTLSTDIFSDLMVYSYMTNTYSEMSKIYDPLEIGTTVIANQKQFVKHKGSKVKEEVLNVMGRVSRRTVKMSGNTSFEKKLRDYLECQVYGKYLKDDDILGVDKQKTLSVFQKMTSMAYLGCNYLAGVANVATAVGMQNIEAAGAEFFNPKDLASADKEYGAMLPSFIAELGSREKQSKLALFDELFDVRQNFKDKLHNTQMSSIFRRFFGNNWLFVQQGMGDHWIYNRTAIAMAKHHKVKLGSREISVWDALEIVTDENGYKKMRVKEGVTNLDGSAFSAGEFSRAIAHINHTIAGIYNDDDQNAANRVVIGRLAQQMRKWIMPQMMRRFQSKRMVLDIGREEEGYYRTLVHLAKDLWKSEFKIKAEWNKLNASEKANIRRALTEIAQTVALFILTHILGGATKDPDRIWVAKFAEYMANRELHELGFLTPGPLMLTEGYKTVTSPFVAASAANKIAQALLTTVNPWNWFPDDDELIQSGRYEGHSYIYKRWAELPLPPFTQFRQIEKFVDDLDTGTKYYARDYK